MGNLPLGMVWSCLMKYHLSEFKVAVYAIGVTENWKALAVMTVPFLRAQD